MVVTPCSRRGGGVLCHTVLSVACERSERFGDLTPFGGGTATSAPAFGGGYAGDTSHLPGLRVSCASYGSEHLVSFAS